MARSIWTAEERELLVQYVAQYKAGDEDARILLLENKVIPKYLAKFPPREVESDADEPEHDHEHEHVDLHEAERRMKQKIRGWFIKKAPANVSLTPRRRPRARGNSHEREVLRHYIELFRVGTERSRKILVKTRVLPEYIRQFHPYGNINNLSQEQRNEYKKHVRDWLTIEAYHRDQGEQDPEQGLNLTLDTYSDSDAGASAPESPLPSVRRKRRMSPSQEDLPTSKKPKISSTSNATSRAPSVSTPHRGARSPSLTAAPRRPAARSPTPSYGSAAPPSPPQTPQPKARSPPKRRNIVHSTPIIISSDSEEGSEPDMEPEPELEPEPEPVLELNEAETEVASWLGSEHEHDLDTELELEYPPAPEPELGTDSRPKSHTTIRARSRTPTPSPQQKRRRSQQDEDEDVADWGEEDGEGERVMPHAEVVPQEVEEETLREDVVMLQESDEEDIVMEDEVDLLQERGPLEHQEESQQEEQQEETLDDDLEYQEEEEYQPEHRLSNRPVATPPPIDANESEHNDGFPGDVQADDQEDQEEEEQHQPRRRLSNRRVATLPPTDANDPKDGEGSPGDVVALARGSRSPSASISRRHITVATRPTLEGNLLDALLPIFRRHFMRSGASLAESVAEEIARKYTDETVNYEQDEQYGHHDHHEDNQHVRKHSNVAATEELEQARQEIRRLKQEKSELGTQIALMHEDVNKRFDDVQKLFDRMEGTSQQVQTMLGKCQALSESTASMGIQFSKKAKSIYDALIDNRGRKSKTKRSRDSTTTATVGAGAASSSASRAQPTAVEILVGRFKKSIGTQATVTYYLARIPGHPIEEAVWLSFEDLARLPNAAILLHEFHDQAEAEGLTLTSTREDYVYLRDAYLAGWNSIGTISSA